MMILRGAEAVDDRRETSTSTCGLQLRQGSLLPTIPVPGQRLVARACSNLSRVRCCLMEVTSIVIAPVINISSDTCGLPCPAVTKTRRPTRHR